MIETVETIELPERYGDRGRLLRRIFEEREGVGQLTDKDREVHERMWASYDPFWEALWREENDG